MERAVIDGAGIRSLLFVPGDNEKLALKALASAADAVIIDLEDAVAPSRKEAARAITAQLLSGAERNGKAVFVRLNAFDSGLTAADLAAVAGGKPWGVVLPKCQDPSQLENLARYLDVLEAHAGIAAGTTRIMSVATETAAAVLNLARPPAPAGGRLWGMLWGGEDLSADLGAVANRDETGAYTFPFQYARTRCLYAASMSAAVAVDAVYTDFRNSDGLRQEALAGLRDGFAAKAAIHPAQVDVINQVMTPDPARIDWARQVMDLLQDAAVAALDGRMIDLAHKRIAKRLLSRVEALAGQGKRV